MAERILKLLLPPCSPITGFLVLNVVEFCRVHPQYRINMQNVANGTEQ